MADKTTPSLNQSFWNKHWQTQNTGWDIGHASSPITKYIDQLSDKDISILIPGCGNAYEAEYLVKQDFTEITLIDIAPKAVERLKQKFANAEAVTVLQKDFFEHNGSYDLMIEQTFFCALPPKRREDYARQAASLLNPNGTLAGVLFNTTFQRPGPPFGGTVDEYQNIFTPYFNIQTMEECYNSIQPRAGSEVFIIFNAGKS